MVSFASDNYAGAIPEIFYDFARHQRQHVRAYGADEMSHNVRALFCDALGQEVDVYFVFNGTGANVLSLSIATHSYQAVLCSDIAHIYADESSAPETFTGCRIFPVKSNEHGKITVDALSARLHRKGDVHYAQPAVVSITQATEYGTVYKPEEIKALSAFCRAQGLYLHLDGARIWNAWAHLGGTLKEMITDCGVDIVSFGGTKAGMMYGEAVIVLNDALKKHAPFKHKQSMQLCSKSWYIALQFDTLLRDGYGLQGALHANKMATQLSVYLQRIEGVQITRPIEANSVFAILPKEVIPNIQSSFPFYVWDESTSEVRLMCSWDTTEGNVASLAKRIALDLEKKGL